MARPPADPADWVFDDANVMTKHTSLSVATRLVSWSAIGCGVYERFQLIAVATE
jgi:hypothetical protein